MYFKKINIKNVGPIGNLSINLPTTESGTPKPLIIVGENGTGKTILISHLVNTLIVAKQSAFDDTEVEHGKVYKYRSPVYIKAGEHYSHARVELGENSYVEEWQLETEKSKFKELYSYTPLEQSWQLIPDGETSHFTSSFFPNDPPAKTLFEKRCCLYFPVNRFEEPAWLNAENLREKAKYTELKYVERNSNRNLILTSPLKANRNWLLDVIFDRQAFEIVTQNLPVQFAPNQPNVEIPIFSGYHGQSTKIYEAVLELLRSTLQVYGDIRLGAGNRYNRQISIIKNNATWIQNIFQLSTGETLLLNLFLSIIRDYDLSGGNLESLNDIKGIVVIDEIDAHLHTVHQKEILPRLIASFPNIQFVITTHSPLFLIGMEEKFGSDGFKIINMPNGETVAASDFSEFTAAYEAFKTTNLYRQEIIEALKKNARPIVFVEGDYDIRYIKKAAELFQKSHILDAIQLKDGAGFGNLDKIWRSYEIQMAEILPSKILLLYDCDTNKASSEKGKIIKRIIPSIPTTPIQTGIENLFSMDLITQLEESHPQFIDSTAETITRTRGNKVILPAKKLINKDEKGNMCNWICANGTQDIFQNFSSIFNIIEEMLGM